MRRERWAQGTRFGFTADGGAEFLVLDGSFEESGEVFGRHDWLRLPDGHSTQVTAGPNGAEAWVKVGHLRHFPRPTAA